MHFRVSGRALVVVAVVGLIGLVSGAALAQEGTAAQSAGGASSLSSAKEEPVRVTIVDPPKPERKNRLTVGPLGLLLGVGSFTYERVLSPKVSLELMPTLVALGGDDASVVGGAFGIGVATYLSGTAPEGFRVSGALVPGFVTAKDKIEETSSSAFLFSAKALLGYNWVWSDGFTMGLGGGFAYLHVNVDDNAGSFNGLLPAIDFNLGFAF